MSCVAGECAWRGADGRECMRSSWGASLGNLTQNSTAKNKTSINSTNIASRKTMRGTLMSRWCCTLKVRLEGSFLGASRRFLGDSSEIWEHYIEGEWLLGDPMGPVETDQQLEKRPFLSVAEETEIGAGGPVLKAGLRLQARAARTTCCRCQGWQAERAAAAGAACGRWSRRCSWPALTRS
jgi:hypothetical protein